PEAHVAHGGPPETTHCESAGRLAGLFHEVITDHVAHDHVGVFDAPHVRRRHLDIELRHRPELPAIAPGERDGAAADGAGVLDRPQYIRRVAGTADPHEQVAALGEIFELLDENRVVGDIVGV